MRETLYSGVELNFGDICLYYICVDVRNQFYFDPLVFLC